MNHNNLAYANIHRIGNNIAIWLNTTDDTNTVYLSEKEARKLSKTLLVYAQDLKSVTFSKSQLKPFTINNQKDANQ